MAAGWSTVILVVGAAAGGYFVGDWVRQREAAEQQAELRKNAEAAVDRAVKAERRIGLLERRIATQRGSVEKDVAESGLADCPVPEPTSRVLDAMAEEAGRAGLPRAAVP